MLALAWTIGAQAADPDRFAELTEQVRARAGDHGVLVGVVDPTSARALRREFVDDHVIVTLPGDDAPLEELARAAYSYGAADAVYAELTGQGWVLHPLYDEVVDAPLRSGHVEVARRHLRVGGAGLGLMGAGYIAAGLGYGGVVACRDLGGTRCSGGYAVFAAGPTLATAGVGLMFWSGLTASSDLRIDRRAGWAGLGLLTGGAGLFAVMVATEADPLGAGLLAASGIGLGVGQFLYASDVADRARRVSVIVTPVGITIAGQLPGTSVSLRALDGKKPHL